MSTLTAPTLRSPLTPVARHGLPRPFPAFSDPEALRAHLEGVDGQWDDVELDVADVPVPILVRRTEPAQVARNWPPPLDMPHRCAAVTLAAVHLPVASIEAAADIYARLLNVEAPTAFSRRGRHRQVVFQLGPATITLVEDGEQRAVVLGVTSLEMSRTVLSSALLPPDDRGIAWHLPGPFPSSHVTRSFALPR